MVAFGKYQISSLLAFILMASISFASDVGITGVKSPVDTVFLEKDSSYVVEVTIKNFGTDTIDTIPVIFQVGFNEIADTFTGALAPDSSISFMFDSLLTISDTSSFIGQARTDLPGDSNQFNDAFLIYYNVPSGLISITGTSFSFELYPNPASDFLNLFFSNHRSSKDVYIKVVDMAGEVFVSTGLSMTKGKQSLSIPVDQLPPGIYVVLIRSGEMRGSMRFLRM